MTQPRIAFAGTPDFALASLRALVDADVAPIAVLTQPDRPAGRGKKLTPGAVKRFAEQQGLLLMQPADLRDAATVAEINALELDILVVAAYGLLLPRDVLDLPTHGCVNVHASLLPRWRGAAPIQAAILAGDAETGVCLMAMEAGLDCGAIYASESTAIGAGETAGELHDRLAELGGALLVRHLGQILAGRLPAVPQDNALATTAAKINVNDALLDWYRPANELERAVRAYNPVPGAWFMLDDERIKCWRAHTTASSGAPVGTVMTAGPDRVTVTCGDGALTLTTLQRPGKRPVTASEFAAQIDLTGRQL